MTSFASMMRNALAEREAAEHELADAVAESALSGGGEASSGLESARASHQEASKKVAKLIEEASRYAAEHRELSEGLQRERNALAESQSALRAAEAKLAASGSSVEGSAREAEEARSQARAANERCRKAVERENAAVQAAREAVDARDVAEESRDAAVAAANASASGAALARAKCDEEINASRLSVSQAQAVVMDTRRTTELELGEARRDADLHRQRRLAARTELLTVAKALEAARGDARSSEQAARDLLVPRLLEHSKILETLVERVVAIGSDLGGSLADLPQPNAQTLRGASSQQMPVKYLGELAEEIQRIDSGLHLLSQSLDVVENAVENNNRQGSCSGILSCCATSRVVRTRLPKVVVNSKKSKGYRRVVDDDDELDAHHDDDTVL